MNRWAWLPVIAFIPLVAKCGERAGVASGCYNELSRVPLVNVATIDVEEMVSHVVRKMGAEPYWADISPIDTVCEAPAVLPDQSDHPALAKAPDGTSKPIRRVRLDGRAGVIFVYHSRGAEEVTKGLAAALVEYGRDGAPGRVYKASELLVGEGWGRLTTSILTGSSIKRCDQELEYFTYNSAGDVIGEMETPSRTSVFCEQIMLSPSAP